MKNSSQTQHHRSETKRKEEKKIEKKNSKLEDAGCRLEAGSNGTVAAGRMEQCLNSDFRNGSENFAIPVKFSLCHIFAMIAKIRYNIESYCA